MEDQKGGNRAMKECSHKDVKHKFEARQTSPHLYVYTYCSGCGQRGSYFIVHVDPNELEAKMVRAKRSFVERSDPPPKLKDRHTYL